MHVNFHFCGPPYNWVLMRTKSHSPQFLSFRRFRYQKFSGKTQVSPPPPSSIILYATLKTSQIVKCFFIQPSHDPQLLIRVMFIENFLEPSTVLSTWQGSSHLILRAALKGRCCLIPTARLSYLRCGEVKYFPKATSLLSSGAFPMEPLFSASYS